MRFQRSEISLHFNSRFLHEIKMIFDFFVFVLKLSFIRYHFPQFLPSICYPIWWNSKITSRNFLIPCGFDPYLPLCHSIRVNFLKFVSSEEFLTRYCVKSTTLRSRLVRAHRVLRARSVRHREWGVRGTRPGRAACRDHGVHGTGNTAHGAPKAMRRSNCSGRRQQRRRWLRRRWRWVSVEAAIAAAAAICAATARWCAAAATTQWHVAYQSQISA